MVERSGTTQEVQRQTRIFAVTDWELAMLGEFPALTVFPATLGGFGLGVGIFGGLDWVSVAGGCAFLCLAWSYPFSARRMVARIRRESKDRTL